MPKAQSHADTKDKKTPGRAFKPGKIARKRAWQEQAQRETMEASRRY